jgi:hypothetical protein
MAVKVKLADVVVGMDSQTDELCSYLNKETGDIVGISDYQYSIAENDEAFEDYPDWEKDLITIAREIISTDKYLQLPSKYEMDEYHIMEKFALALEDHNLSDAVYSVIKGPGAFRRFKEAIHKLSLVDDWHGFRDRAIRQLAIDWCSENNIQYLE